MTWTLPDFVPNFPMYKPSSWDVVPHTTIPGGEHQGVMEVRVGTYHSTQYTAPVEGQRKWIILQSKDYRQQHAYDLNQRRVWTRVIAELWQETNGPSMDDYVFVEAFLERHYAYYVRVPDFPHAVERWAVVYQPINQVDFVRLGPTEGRSWTDHYEYEGSINLIKSENLPTPVQDGETLDDEMGVMDGVVFVGLKTSFDTGGPAYNAGCYYQWTARDTQDVEPNVDGLASTPGSPSLVTGLDVAEIKSSANFGKSVLEAENPLCDVNLDGMVNGLDVAAITSSSVWGT